MSTAMTIGRFEPDEPMTSILRNVISAELEVALRKYLSDGPDDSARSATFRCDGDFWTISYEGLTVRLRDTAGLRYLSQLFANVGAEVAAFRMAEDSMVSAIDLGDRGPLLDAQARADYRARISDLRSELEEGERNRDLGRVEAAKREIAAIECALSSAFGLGGRSHRAGAAERARQSVAVAMKRALRKIEEVHQPLAEHLRRTVRTGMFCRYDPDPRARVEWAL